MAATGLWRPLDLQASDLRPEDSIVETPSLVVPLLLKSNEAEVPNQPNGVNNDDDDVQIIEERGSNLRSVEDFTREAYVATLTKRTNQGAILALKNYYHSSAGKLLFGVGIRRVFERNMESKAKKLHRRLQNASIEESPPLFEELKSIKGEIALAQEHNKPFQSSERYKCQHCRFTTEFRMVLESHLEIPHMNRKEYLCNWCTFRTKNADRVIAHFLHDHKKRCRIEKPLAIHLCRYCPYETNSKRLIASHYLSCEKSFPIDSFQSPKDFGGNDFPGVTSKFITQDDIKACERTRNALLLSSYNPHQLKVSSLNENGEQRQVLIIPGRSSIRNLGHTTHVPKPSIGSNGGVCSPLQQFANSLERDRHQRSKGFNNNCDRLRLLQLLPPNNRSAPLNPSILQHPQYHSPFMNGKSVMISASAVIMAPAQQIAGKSGLAPAANHLPQGDTNQVGAQSSSANHGQSSSSSSGGFRGNQTGSAKRSSFIICEICDCYTRDLHELKSHMMSIHDVKIHQRTFERRPPLSCQRCKWRFFTDQGLERHLLGVHSFVTAHMQSLVDQGRDSGRCTVCGKALANKLVAHVKDVHKANLKLAHLTYKCTICTATFNLYGLFENHVHSVHPESLKETTDPE